MVKASRGGGYWLMKSEPSCYSIDDLKRDRKTMWDGVRNYQVRNMMRDAMRVGDRVFFYHSNAEEIGIVGEMEIIKAAYPDPTQFDPTLTFTSPQHVASLERIVKMCTAPGTHVYLKYFGKNNEKVRVGVDPTSEHPDPKSDPNDPRWLCVDVKFVKKYPDVLSLAAIKADTVLRTMRVAEKGSRLSITPVTKTQYQRVLDLVKK